MEQVSYSVSFKSAMICPRSGHVLNENPSNPRGVDPAYERGGKFWIKPLKETDLGVAQAFFDP